MIKKEFIPLVNLGMLNLISFDKKNLKEVIEMFALLEIKNIAGIKIKENKINQELENKLREGSKIKNKLHIIIYQVIKLKE